MNEKTIRDFLIQKVKNPFGVSAIMGNLMAESSLNPLNATGKNKTANYVSDADSGKIDFAHDGVAFGLVQWCYHSRKQGLIDYARSKNASVGDLKTQLEYLVMEMSKSYKTAWNAVVNATSIRTASDVVMLKYEKPAGTGEAAKQKRASDGQKYYDTYAVKETTQKQEEAKPVSGDGKTVVLTKDNVNIRTGNGKQYASVGKAKLGSRFELISKADNGWYAVKLWVSGDCAEVK